MEIERLRRLIEQGCENEYLDFKKQFHENKAELLHDILCLANNTQFQDAYLVFGIDDSGQIVGVENHKNRLNSANIHDFLNSNRSKFFNYEEPSIEVFTLQYSGHEIDVLKIKSTFHMPSFLIECYSDGKVRVRSGHVYSRTGDRNTPIDQFASPSVVETLWKKRFFLLEKHYDRFYIYLNDLSNWKMERRHKDQIVRYYYEPEPTFIVETTIDFEDREFLPYYQSYPNSLTSIYRGSYNCIANQVVIESGDLYFINDAKSVFPETEYYTFQYSPSSNLVLSMDYYLKDSIKFRLLSLLNREVDGHFGHGLLSFLDQTLIFSSENEVAEFIAEVKKNIKGIVTKVEKSSEIGFNNAPYDPRNHDKFRIHTGLVLKKMHHDLQIRKLENNDGSSRLELY